jgi:cysteine synthase
VNPEARNTKLNLTGSVKEAWLSTFSQEQNLPRHIIAEATAGNTGISFAAIGRVLGRPVKIFIVRTGWSANIEWPNGPLTLQAFGLAGRINWLANR